MRNVIVIGSGPAGLTAAIYAARANLKPLVIEGMTAGGQLTQTTEIENFPGFAEPLGGAALMAAMRQQAERCGAEFLMDEVQSVDFSGGEKKLETMMNGTLLAKAVIVATGAAAKWTLLPGEAKYRGHGVSACATCDGSFFRGQAVAVIGGGDTAMGDALYLARMCSAVTIVHRRNAFRASKVMVDRVLSTPNITVAWDSTVDEFLGANNKLSGLRLKSTVDGSTRLLDVTGAFVAIGHDPVTAFLGDQVKKDVAGYVIATNGHTSAKGVFAAGDCADPVYKQAIVAAGAGAVAALECEKYLLSL